MLKLNPMEGNFLISKKILLVCFYINWSKVSPGIENILKKTRFVKHTIAYCEILVSYFRCCSFEFSTKVTLKLNSVTSNTVQWVSYFLWLRRGWEVFDGNFHSIWSQKLVTLEKLPTIKFFSQETYVNAWYRERSFWASLSDLPGEVGKHCRTWLM